MSQLCASVLLLVGKQGIVLDADPTLFERELPVRFKFELEPYRSAHGLFVLANCYTMAGLFFPGGSDHSDWEFIYCDNSTMYKVFLKVTSKRRITPAKPARN